MKSAFFALFLGLVYFVPLIHAADKSAGPADETKVGPAGPASEQRGGPDVAAPPIWKDGKIERKFLGSHNGNVAVAKKGEAELVFLGDSITQGWLAHKDIWEKSFGSYKPANFGIGWDRTQGVLWRVENGEMDGIHPKVVVLLIGTNNIVDDPPEGIARGITKIIEQIRATSPATKVLLLGILPRGKRADKNPAREKIAQVNAIISKLDDGGRTVKYVYFGEKLLQPDGTISADLMPDFLHFKAPGYQIWADAIEQALKELMGGSGAR